MARQEKAISLQRRGLLPSKVWRTLRRYLKSKQLVLGGTLVLFFVFAGVFGPYLAPYDYAKQDLRSRLQPPIFLAGGSLAHPLGTDQLGRDQLSRLMRGARVSLLVAVVAVGMASAFGVTMGLVSGYFGGLLGTVIMRIVDIQYALPFLLLAIMIVSFLGPGLEKTILVLASGGWLGYARVTRGNTLSVKEEMYIEAARAVGVSNLVIIRRHILPNILAPVLVLSSFQVASLILAEATLSFLGLGIQPPEPSWGGMLSTGRSYMATAPWLTIVPGLALMFVALGANQLGDGLRDMWDPRLRGTT